MSSTHYLTPLMRASAVGHLDDVKEQLKLGANINEKGLRGSTALIFAAESGHLEVVRELVDRGADVNARAEGGWTARRFAEDNEDRAMEHFLADVEFHWLRE